jgi:hypothetical protein
MYAFVLIGSVYWAGKRLVSSIVSTPLWFLVYITVMGSLFWIGILIGMLGPTLMLTVRAR